MGNKNSGRRKNELVMRQNILIALDKIDPSTGRKKMLAVIDALIREAADGNVPAIKELIERVDGKMPQRTDVSATVDARLELIRSITDAASPD